MTELLDVADLAVAQMRAARRHSEASLAYHRLPADDRDEWSDEAVELRAAKKALGDAQKAYDAACGDLRGQITKPTPPAEQEGLFG